MQQLFSEPGAPREGGPSGRRLAVLAISLVLAGVPLSLALFLGDWAYDYRRLSLHQGRLERLLEREPQVTQVVAGLEAEGASLLGAPVSESRLRETAALWGGARAEEICRKGRNWPQVRVFRVSDVVYVLYFDAAGVMQGFTLVAD
jgi:hypothetical protein